MTDKTAPKSVPRRLSGAKNSKPRRRVATARLTVVSVDKHIEKAGGPLGVARSVHRHGLVASDHMMRKLAKWARQMQLDEMNTEQKMGLLQLLPRFQSSLDALGETLADRERAARAALIPPEPGASVPLIAHIVSEDGDDVPVSAEVVTVDGDEVSESPLDAPYEHPEVLRIMDSGRKLTEERAAERRRTMAKERP